MNPDSGPQGSPANAIVIPHEVGWLKKAIKSVETSLARLRSDEALVEVRAGICAYRAATRHSHHDWDSF
jgi:hypothetical protein